MSGKKSVFSGITRKQNIEFGLVLVLVSCVLAWLYEAESFILAAIIVSLTTIISPVIFTPLTALWFGLSHVLGKISSTILLSIIFYLVVTPVGVIRRISGKDSLRLKEFKKEQHSVMIERDHLYRATDLKDTF